MDEKKILIIEDEPDVAKVLTVRLNNAGYKTVVAGDGMQGIQLAHQEKPNLIILDLKLPAGDGLSVLENLKLSSFLRYTPVVILTGLKIEEYKRQAAEKAVDAYIEKPYEPDVLLRSIKNLLGEL